MKIKMLNKLQPLLGTEIFSGLLVAVPVMADPFYDGSRLSIKESSFEKPVSKKVVPWAPEGLEAIWSSQHSTHPRFMEIRRAEYEQVQDNLNAPSGDRDTASLIINLYDPV